MAPYVDDGQPADETRVPASHDHIAFHAAVASLAQNRVLEIALQTMGQIVSHHFVTTDDPRQLRSMIHRRPPSTGSSHHRR